MTAPLVFYSHPFSSFCQKVLVALYENATPFEAHEVNFGDPEATAAFKALWPVGKIPVLQDRKREAIIPESTIIIEYLAQYYPGAVELVPHEPDHARHVRMKDRFYDLHVQEPMQKIVADRLRPVGLKDPFGVDQARAALQTAYELIEHEMGHKTWAAGEAFTMADCAAAPALFYADLVAPLGDKYPKTSAYLARLMARPSFARVVKEAEYFMPNFPKE